MTNPFLETPTPGRSSPEGNPKALENAGCVLWRNGPNGENNEKPPVLNRKNLWYPADMLHGSVGVAPSTVTIAFPPYRRWNPYADVSSLKQGLAGPGLGVIDPKDWWMTGQAYGLPVTASLYIPPGRMRPPPKMQSPGGRFNGLGGLGIIPGEINRSLNGAIGLGDNFGAIPTDFELATYREYLPVQSGWTTAQQGLGDASDRPTADNVDQIHPMDPMRIKCMKHSIRHQKLALRLQMITTGALVILAFAKLVDFAGMAARKG